MTYAQTVSYYRKKLKMSRKALSECIGKSSAWIISIEAGLTLPANKDNEKLCRVLGCDAEALRALAYAECPREHINQAASPLSRKSYIYGLVDPNTFVIKYIGKARTLGSRLRSHITDRPSNLKPSKVKVWIDQLVASGKQPCMVILETTTMAEAEGREKYWIRHYYANDLVNTEYMREIAEELSM